MPKSPLEVKIYRDRFGVPHIYGQTDLSVFYGFGYAQAEDHLIPMLMNFMEAKGRIAEILGEEYIETDYKTRLYMVPEKVKENYGKISEDTRRISESFSKGINLYISEHQETLPEWVEPVKPEDIIGFTYLVMLRWCEASASQLLEPGPIFEASNQWVVAPNRTVNGKVILSMDPHVGWSRLSYFYEAHLRSAEGLNVAGGTFFGMPVIALGHNDHIAWSETMNISDAADIYAEKVNKDRTKYLYEGEWLDIKRKEITIKVRKGDVLRKEKRTLYYTHHGPILKFKDETAYAIRLSHWDCYDTISEFYRINKSTNLDEFKQALSMLEIPTFNFIYGDIYGNIYYVCNCRCPIRSEKYDWKKPVPGWTAETEWQGFLPFDQLPQIENPPSGFLQNCNNDPSDVTVDSGIKLENYPSYVACRRVTGRTKRLLTWLHAHKKITVRDARRISMDTYNMTAEEIKPKILQAYENLRCTLSDPDGHMAQAINILREWDNFDSLKSLGSTIFAVWFHYYTQISKDKTNIPAEEKDRLIMEALRRAISFLTDKFGHLEVPWGLIHKMKRGEKEYPLSGASILGTESLHVTLAEKGLSEDGEILANGGSTFMMIVELGKRTVKAWSIVPFGNSEDPASKHYADQAPIFSRNRYKMTCFTERSILRNLESEKTLTFDLL